MSESKVWHEVSETRDYTTLTIHVPRGYLLEWKGQFRATGEIILEVGFQNFVRLRFKPTKPVRVIIQPEVESEKNPKT